MYVKYLETGTVHLTLLLCWCPSPSQKKSLGPRDKEGWEGDLTFMMARKETCK